MNNPILLQKQLRDNSKDLRDFCKELQEWGDEMKRKETSHGTEAAQSRSKVAKMEEAVVEPKKSKRISSNDYKAWEKFDADAYSAKLDEKAEDDPVSDESDALSDEIDGSMVDLANCEKEKGNAFVKKQRWDDAIKCYTKAIECYAYEPIYYANRALCYLKKKSYRNAESDCTTALQLDKKYVKAYQRRAAVRDSLNQLNEARDDLLRVLELEPKNVESKAALVKLEKKMEDSKQQVAEAPRTVSKFTLSRQNQKPPLHMKVKEVDKRNDGISAIKEHVVEKKAPSTSVKTKPEPVKLAQPCWPSGSDVELFQCLAKPRKSRLMRPLRRIKIVDVDILDMEPQGPTNSSDAKEYKIIKSTFSNEVDKMKIQPQPKIETDEHVKIIQQISEDTKKIHSLHINVVDKQSHKVDSKRVDTQRELNDLCLPVPKSSVQFYNGWRTIRSDRKLRYHYMKGINPDELPDIFKESLESKVFEEMIETLCSEKNTLDNAFISGWLWNLSNVRRFHTLIMFMSSDSRNRIVELISYLKEDNKFSDVEIDSLLGKYQT